MPQVRGGSVKERSRLVRLAALEHEAGQGFPEPPLGRSRGAYSQASP